MFFKTSHSSISSRAILITGCSSGIGYYVAHQLKNRGYWVFATARQPTEVVRLQQEGLESLILDLNDSDSISQAVQTVLERTDGRLYGLFNNGGYAQFGAVEDLTRETLRQQFETNLFGTHELTYQVLPTMREQGEGRIIQNSSVLGLVAIPYLGAYNASKFALEGLTDTLRLELAGSGIFVSLIEPGCIVSQIKTNGYSRFKQQIDIENSRHQKIYVKFEKLLTQNNQNRCSSPEVVLKKVIHALESKHPLPRYPITSLTYLSITLKQLLPSQVMDWLLLKWMKSHD